MAVQSCRARQGRTTKHVDGKNLVSIELDLSAAWDIVRSAVYKETVPGAVALVRRQGRTVLHEAAGWAALEPERRAMHPDTIFDLASLTKPLVTAPLVLQLVDSGIISLDEPACRYLPSLARFADGTITVRQLLLHSSGLPAWSPVYVWASTRADVLHTIAAMEPAYAPGSRVIYSCLGYIVLGILLEHLTGQTLDDLAAHSLFAPLGVHDTGYGPAIDETRCAWTERGNSHEQASVAAAGRHFEGWREDCIPGTVHVGNAWYAMGGVSGNAGLFGTAHDVGILGQMWLNGGNAPGIRVLQPQTVTAAITDGTTNLNEARGLGWQINRAARDDSEAPGSAGTHLSARAFGHTGFTGTSLWMDPALDLVAVLLTNRVHPRVGDSAPVTQLRSSFHDAVATALQSTTHSASA